MSGQKGESPAKISAAQEVSPNGNGNGDRQEGTSTSPTTKRSSISHRSIIISSILVGLMILGLALGLGLGLGLRHNATSTSLASSPTSSLQSPSTTSTPISTVSHFVPGVYISPISCPNSLPDDYDVLYTFPETAEYNATLLAFNSTDPTLNFTLIGTPTFNYPPQLFTYLQNDNNETALYTFFNYTNQTTQTLVSGVTATVANGSSLTIYDNGNFEFYLSHCTAAVFGTVNLTSLSSQTKGSSASWRRSTRLLSRESCPSHQIPFSVTLTALDFCNNPIKGLHPTLRCQVEISVGMLLGPLQNPFDSTVLQPLADNGDGTYSGRCQSADTGPYQCACQNVLEKLCTIPLGKAEGDTFCEAVGGTIGREVGGGIGFAAGGGVVSIGTTIVGVIIGGQVGQWFCDQLIDKFLNDPFCKALVGTQIDGFCKELTAGEAVAVDVVDLPGGATAIFPSVGATGTVGVIATKVLDVPRGATCSPGLCNHADFSASQYFNQANAYGSADWDGCNSCCVAWSTAMYGGPCLCCTLVRVETPRC